MDLARLAVEDSDGIVVARVNGEIDMSNADGIGAEVLTEVRNDQVGVIVDLTGLTYLDSAGIRMLFELRNQIVSRALRLRVVVATGEAVEATLQLVGAQQPLGVVATVQAAREQISAA